MEGALWDDGATEAGLNSRDSDTLAAPPLPRLGPLGRRGLDLGADCDCEAVWPEASACMVAGVVEAVVPFDVVMFSVSLLKDLRRAGICCIGNASNDVLYHR